jgi:hypothetical protein
VVWCYSAAPGSTIDGLNGVGCCLFGGAVGAVSLVTGYKVSQCAAVGNERGTASFGLSTCEVFVGCRNFRGSFYKLCLFSSDHPQ